MHGTCLTSQSAQGQVMESELDLKEHRRFLIYTVCFHRSLPRRAIQELHIVIQEQFPRVVSVRPCKRELGGVRVKAY